MRFEEDRLIFGDQRLSRWRRHGDEMQEQANCHRASACHGELSFLQDPTLTGSSAESSESSRPGVSGWINAHWRCFICSGERPVFGRQSTGGSAYLKHRASNPLCRSRKATRPALFSEVPE